MFESTAPQIPKNALPAVVGSTLTALAFFRYCDPGTIESPLLQAACIALLKLSPIKAIESKLTAVRRF